MSIESRLSGHWTDEQLIESLYGVGPADRHLENCSVCAARFAALRAQRQSVETTAGEDVSHEFLAAQRRRIYARMGERSQVAVRRWVSAAAVCAVLGGSVVVLYQQKSQQEYKAPEKQQITDVELARDVSCMAREPGAQSTAPLQALFEE